MSEKTMRGRVVRKALRPLDAVAVENPAYPGTPDVNYIDGWIELKWIRRWPKTCWDRPVLIKHYTQQQRLWLARRQRKGGKAWLLLQVQREWLLFDAVGAQQVGKVTRRELYELAHRVWKNGLNEKELRQCLS